jgi:hypothetical protein
MKIPGFQRKMYDGLEASLEWEKKVNGEVLAIRCTL